MDYLIIIYIELYLNLHGLINFYSMNDQFSSVDSSQEQQIPLPVKFLYPPNQILTKSYPPDIKPVFKLMTKRDSHEKPTINNSHHLIQKFEDCDTLGYDYSSHLKNSLAYLKFNNQNYFQLTSKGKTYKYMTGLFVPQEDLLNPLVKSSESLYNVLKNTEYTSYKSNPFESISSKNSYDLLQETVKFSSNFASGNLFAVIKNSSKSYTLFLQNDINSRSNTQWFNFVAQLPSSCSYTFKIVNFTKSSSLFEKGMHIAYFSQLDYQNYKIGWQKGCTNITYQSTDTLRQQSSNQYYYCLKFEYESKYQNDIVQFAYNFPYNSLDLQKFFSRIHYKKISFTYKFEKYKICETLSGEPVYGYCLIPKKHRKSLNDKTLKSFGSMSLLNRNISVGNLSNTNANKPPKLKSLIFMGRQHPGETQSSFVIQGIIQFLLENNDYQSIKGSYFIYIVPIVNIDGVLYGNYRSNLSGNDLNRIWRNPRKDLHCEIYHIKKWFIDINRETPIQLIIDIHGHSKSFNSFFYGMPMKKDTLLYPGSTNQNSKFYPYLCSKKCKQISFIQSTFSVTEDKKNTARVVLSEMFPKALIYTFQNSFYGWKKGSEIVEYTIENYRKIGRQLVSAYFDYIRLIEKNNDIAEKWQKQIDQVFGNENSEKQVDSDSENENDLISPNVQEKISQFQLKYAKQKAISAKRLGRIINKPRQTFIPVPQNPLFPKSSSYNMRRVNSKQSGFLSIVKIDPKPDQSLCLSQQRGNEKSLKIFNQRELMQKLRKRKVNLDEVIKNCTGVKGFLRAMGITIQRR